MGLARFTLMKGFMGNMRLGLWGLLLLFALTSCAKKEKEETPVSLYEGGRDKPLIALVPVIDHSGAKLDWNLSEEMTLALQQRLSENGHFYLLAPHKVRTAMKQLRALHNPFGNDLSWVKKVFSEGEFVAFVECIDHAERTLHSKTGHSKTGSLEATTPTELQTSVRVRVLDLRGDEPKVALQEMIHNAYYIPAPFNKLNFQEIPWGKEHFEISPLGIAHSEWLQEISSRISDYIRE